MLRIGAGSERDVESLSYVYWKYAKPRHMMNVMMSTGPKITRPARESITISYVEGEVRGLLHPLIC